MQLLLCGAGWAKLVWLQSCAGSWLHRIRLGFPSLHCWVGVALPGPNPLGACTKTMSSFFLECIPQSAAKRQHPFVKRVLAGIVLRKSLPCIEAPSSPRRKKQSVKFCSSCMGLGLCSNYLEVFLFIPLFSCQIFFLGMWDVPRESLRAGCEYQGTKSSWAPPEVAKGMSAGASNPPWDVWLVAGWLPRWFCPSPEWPFRHQRMACLLLSVENAECYHTIWRAVVEKLGISVS